MKASKQLLASILTLSACALCTAQEVHDFRIVSGKTIDLGSVHAWLADRKGERPLKHWKQIEVLQTQGRLGAWLRCDVKTESGTTATILLKNAGEIERTFQKASQTRAEVERARAAVNSLSAEIRHAEAVNHDYNMANTYNPDAGIRYVKASAREQLTNMGEQLQNLVARHQQELAIARAVSKTLAMFTGQKYSGFEVWDCGARKQ